MHNKKVSDTLKKFWNVKNESSASADIFIYGDITSEAWFDTDTTAKSFVDDLNSFGGKPVTVHLNSGGGDVFQALAISNSLRSYKGGVTIAIDGIAASAASLIAMGGNKITMAGNALMMTHAPSVGLIGYYDADELTRVQTQLSAVQDSIVKTYAARVGNSAAKLVAQETWINAREALELGLIDEITGDVELKVDDAKKLMFVNSLEVSTKKFDAAKMRRAMEAKTMDDKFVNQLKETVAEAMKPTPPPAEPVVDVAAIRQQELSRIRDLQALKCGNSAVDAIIDVALGDGRTVAEIQPYIDALQKIPAAPAATNVSDKIVALIRDQLTSGAENVSGGQTAPTEAEIKAAQAKKIADIANGLM